uniref:RING-type domain-containing protein n=1 Tax=Opuntia streptacantha TaxID=393608 RepID=A0A7C9E2Y7_OPUST
MSGASVIFYGRRSRSTRSFDDLGFRGSTSSSSSSSSSSSDRGSQHHRCRKTDLHRRCRGNHSLDEFPRPLLVRQPVVASEPQQGFVFDCPSQDISRETSLSGRFNGHDRLPVPVLLAKERLLQRLRGVSVSGSSSSGEVETSSSGNDFREVAAVRETSDSTEQPPLYSFIELPSRVHHQSALQEPTKKLPGLAEETLSQLHHEIYLEHQKGVGGSASHDCSICLENFVQGNELISLGCRHRFHTVCLYPWLQTCGECPNCRSSILTSSFQK